MTNQFQSLEWRIWSLRLMLGFDLVGNFGKTWLKWNLKAEQHRSVVKIRVHFWTIVYLSEPGCPPCLPTVAIVTLVSETGMRLLLSVVFQGNGKECERKRGASVLERLLRFCTWNIIKLQQKKNCRKLVTLQIQGLRVPHVCVSPCALWGGCSLGRGVVMCGLRGDVQGLTGLLLLTGYELPVLLLQPNVSTQLDEFL